MNKHQKEYIHRINRVIDFVEANLEEELTLEKLSRVANFSAYHFHRIFSAFTGETLNGFVKRKRVEKAGSLLINNPEVSVKEIAYSCGFNNFPVFCRNFKEHFKMNALEFRKYWEVQNSKNGQSKSNFGQSNLPGDNYVYSIQSQLNVDTNMTRKIEVKQMPAMELVYCRHIGDFHLIEKAYEKLFRWAGPRGLLNNPGFKTVTVYHDDPNVTEMDKVRQSACITVDSKVETEGEFGNLSVPGGKYVVGRFEISDKEFEQAWDAVCLWLSESGYQPADGFPYELYHNDHTNHPERKFILDICIPVKPM